MAVGPDGVDEVELLLRPHPGAPPLPLQRGASGGELSRVMLAIEVVFAGSDPVPTMVFDEVDAGVGGRAAVEIGRRLARLARDHQVLVVTHLPQVAAFADRHLVVDKTDADGRGHPQRGRACSTTPTGSRELARMLAGLADSDTGQRARRGAAGGRTAHAPPTSPRTLIHRTESSVAVRVPCPACRQVAPLTRMRLRSATSYATPRCRA